MHIVKKIKYSVLIGLVLSSLSVGGQEVTDQATAEQVYPGFAAEVVPELATRGKYPVGVRTITLVNPAQLDLLSQSKKDRQLTLEVWYPGLVGKNNGPEQKQKARYDNQTRLGLGFSLQGDAYRNADILVPDNGGKFPLVVLSHGYTGYRTLMFYLGEHLASHGYIVASLDHTDSTNAEVDMKNAPFSGFFSTLLNRSRDQQFTLEQMTTGLNFVSAVINKQAAGLIGYSMGGYGAINTIGGCYHFNQTTAAQFTGISDPQQLNQAVALLNSCAGGQYQDIKVDAKWKAAVAMAPWGGQHNLFDQASLAKISTPTLYVSGSLDDVSDYQSIKTLFDKTGSQDTYLLTYQNARHNIAPHPAPKVAYASEMDLGHYHEPAWSNITLNHVNKHFALAMMDCHVKNILATCDYLALSNNSNQTAQDGVIPPPWKGFDNRYSTGMLWQKKNADKNAGTVSFNRTPNSKKR